MTDVPMANTSTPASLRLCAGGVTSSCDFPSVMRTAILGMPGLDPDSGLKLFSRMKVRARPGRTAHTVSHNKLQHTENFMVLQRLDIQNNEGKWKLAEMETWKRLIYSVITYFKSTLCCEFVAFCRSETTWHLCRTRTTWTGFKKEKGYDIYLLSFQNMKGDETQVLVQVLGTLHLPAHLFPLPPSALWHKHRPTFTPSHPERVELQSYVVFRLYGPIVKPRPERSHCVCTTDSKTVRWYFL